MLGKMLLAAVIGVPLLFAGSAIASADSHPEIADGDHLVGLVTGEHGQVLEVRTSDGQVDVHWTANTKCAVNGAPADCGAIAPGMRVAAAGSFSGGSDQFQADAIRARERVRDLDRVAGMIRSEAGQTLVAEKRDGGLVDVTWSEDTRCPHARRSIRLRAPGAGQPHRPGREAGWRYAPGESDRSLHGRSRRPRSGTRHGDREPRAGARGRDRRWQRERPLGLGDGLPDPQRPDRLRADRRGQPRARGRRGAWQPEPEGDAHHRTCADRCAAGPGEAGSAERRSPPAVGFEWIQTVDGGRKLRAARWLSPLTERTVTGAGGGPRTPRRRS